MKLQVALDLTSKRKALDICRKIAKHVDIIELGTPLIKQEGLKIVKDFKQFKKPIVADLKTMDTGFLEAELAFKAGADISTVCAAAGKETIKQAIKAARKYKGQIMVDLIGVKNVVEAAKEASNLGANYVCVHTGIDMQYLGKTPFADLKKVSKVVPCKKLAVAGGINLENIAKIIKFKPAIIIVGGAITKAKNPEDIALHFKNILRTS